VLTEPGLRTKCFEQLRYMFGGLVKRNRANHDANKEGRFCIGITTDLEQPLSGVLNTSLRCARLA
jgi:hypothetical protein